MKKGLPILIMLAVVLVSRSFAQTTPKVLAELFSNINCGNCSGPDEQYFQFDSLHPEYGIVVINYHNGISEPPNNPHDPFYLASRSSVDAREAPNFYNVTQNPTGFLDGIPTSQTQWTATTQQYAQSPLNPIAVSASKDANDLIHITFTATGPSSGPSTVYVALKESHIVYANTEAYGNPPSGYWDNIFRVMLPGPTGSDPLAANQTKDFDMMFDPSLHPTWNLQYMDAVVFVQDVAGSSSAGFNVESVGDVSLAPLSAIAQTVVTCHSRLLISDNPVVSQYHIGFELAESAQVRITLSDMLGRMVRMLVDGRMPTGQTSIELSAGSLPSGCYIVRMFVDGQEADHAKLIVE